MVIRTPATYLGSVSVASITAAAICLSVDARADCFPSEAGPNAVTVDCSAGDGLVTAPFATSYTESDGSGSDSISITGGQILNTGPSTPDGGEGGPFLDASPGVIQTLGGDDNVDISGGQIGAEGDEINIDLG